VLDIIKKASINNTMIFLAMFSTPVERNIQNALIIFRIEEKDDEKY